jgi:chromosome segregation ATPase
MRASQLVALRAMTTRLLPIAVAALAGLLAAHAQAASFGDGKAKGPLLTRAELRECLAQQQRLRGDAEAMRSERERIEADKAELQRKGDELRDQLAALDRSSPDAVDAYNQRALDRDAAIDALEARMPPFNAKVEALAAAREAFVKRCENRRYDERDEIAIRNGK